MKRFFSITLLLALVVSVKAQITGEIYDTDGYPIPLASAIYKGHHVAEASDLDGKFKIARHNGWELTFSSVGFQPQTIKVGPKTPSHLKIVLKEDAHNLGEVVIKQKREHYSRKNNPAVELMKRVIAAKKRSHLENYDYYQYNKYQKITFSLNDIKPADLDSSKFFKKRAYVKDQIETSPYNGKLILPVSVDETVTQHIYRKDPKVEKDIIKGQRSEGVNNVLQTGEILNTMLREVFTDVDIYDDHMRLLQYQFTSPIGETAISFYRFYIQDTVYVDRDLCYHLEFIPNNQQDFGFRGELYVLADSSLHVKRCSFTLPKKSDVNFVHDMKITQEYTKLPNGEWALSADDMAAELKLLGAEMLVTKATRYNDYAFDELPSKLFRGKAKTMHEADAMIRDDDFWAKYRTVELSHGESSMKAFIHRIEQSKNFKWILFGLRAFAENFVETGSMRTKSKFDIGPVTTIISNNFVDNWRFRLSGRTTANLCNHFFWNGYYAYGTKSKNHYYGSEFTYSLNAKKNVPFEFPQRNIIFETGYDVMSPADKFLIHNKDNMFMSFRTQKVDQMYFYNRQKLSFVYETDWGLSFHTSLKAESNEPTGDLAFIKMPGATLNPAPDGNEYVRKIRTTEAQIMLRYCPGQTFINTKQHRWPVNLDAPEFSLSHTTGVKNVLGGQYNLNFTEAKIYKRFWLGSWGYVDTHLDGGVQWNKVPFPLLIMPPVNITFLEWEGTFSMMKNMEFLTDRYAFASVAWDMNGKLLNRIPLIKKLKWREYISVKGMWGALTDKNNPLLDRNQNDAMLFQFPKDAREFRNNEPYWEITVGVHNIFKLLAIDYVRRMNYNGLGIKKNGIRFGFMLTF
ncbi:MAG: DUF5686 and carboxypeptidase regulatory-like domain-containing protein [Prevotella sp.]|nr:DUF5686 and carboxypeptidase regulatory-like domain-containing protein [Prevotella sp.]